MAFFKRIFLVLKYGNSLSLHPKNESVPSVTRSIFLSGVGVDGSGCGRKLKYTLVPFSLHYLFLLSDYIKQYSKLSYNTIKVVSFRNLKTYLFHSINNSLSGQLSRRSSSCADYLLSNQSASKIISAVVQC